MINITARLLCVIQRALVGAVGVATVGTAAAAPFFSKIPSKVSFHFFSTSFRLTLPLVLVLGNSLLSTTTIILVLVILSWRYRRAWNGRILRRISSLSFSGFEARVGGSECEGSMKRTGEGRCVPTTTHSEMRCAQVARTLSSIDLQVTW